MTLKFDPPDLESDPVVARELLADGWLIAGVAASNAPVESGEGAKSIRAELASRSPVEVRVSWDRDHFYMSFHEFGTEQQPARPFLRPAAMDFQ